MGMNNKSGIKMLEMTKKKKKKNENQRPSFRQGGEKKLPSSHAAWEAAPGALAAAGPAAPGCAAAGTQGEGRMCVCRGTRFQGRLRWGFLAVGFYKVSQAGTRDPRH